MKNRNRTVIALALLVLAHLAALDSVHADQLTMLTSFGLPNSSYPTELVDVNGTLFFFVQVCADGGRELWKSDGTAAGTVLVNRDLTRFAGSTSLGNVDDTGSAARLNYPLDVTIDNAGNLYVADYFLSTILKGYPPPKILNFGFIGGQFHFDLTGPPGQLVIVEASPDLLSWLPIWTLSISATRKAAFLRIAFTAPICRSRLSKLAQGKAHMKNPKFRAAGNLYVSDVFNRAIRKVTPEGVVTTLAGLPRTSGSADDTNSDARFNTPSRLAVDSVGNVYVRDNQNSTIRKVTPEGVATTLAGWRATQGARTGRTASRASIRPTASPWTARATSMWRGNHLYVGGQFATAGGVAANGIVKQTRHGQRQLYITVVNLYCRSRRS